MRKVILDMSMSLDGFIAGPKDEDGGLHDYFFSPSGDTAQVVEEGIKTTGRSSWAGGVTILETSLTDLSAPLITCLILSFLTLSQKSRPRERRLLPSSDVTHLTFRIVK